MCGVIGYSGFKNPSALEEGLKLISHRGPDDSGTFFDNNLKVGLGHRRLSIIDLSKAGHQPMISNDGKVIIVFNGEIYNFRNLKSELESVGYSFKGNSDTEVLLNLYLAEGDRMLEKLNGIFSFAIWDSRSKEIFLARDHFGIKPMYYSSENGNFLFSSEIKALRPMLDRPFEIDQHAVNRHLSFIWSPGERTILKSVKKLLPGHALKVVDGKVVKKWNWYQLPITKKSKSNLSLNESIIGTENYLRQAVHRQMISDAPLGAFLSGGLDSSSIAVFAREINPDIRCFTMKSDFSKKDGQIDDLPYARNVADHLSLKLDVVEINSGMMANDLEKMVMHLDEPLADPACLNVMYISQLARKEGIKVLLSGAGGDDLFTGYRRHYALELQSYWKWLPKNILEFIESSTDHLNTNVPLQRRLKKYFSGINLESNRRIANYFKWADQKLVEELYTDDFRNTIDGLESVEPILSYLDSVHIERSDLEKMLAVEQRFFLTDHNLLYTDKMSMAVGVEARVPFLDIDLVNFASNIPKKYLQKGAVGKWVFKKAMEAYLPKDIIYRSKTGFGAPLRHWVQNEFHEIIGDLLSPKSIKDRGIFSEKAVQNLLSKNSSGSVDASHTILSILCLEIWCRNYIDL